MPFNIVRNDITKMKVDVIVNAANTDLKMGGGVSGAIFKAANSKKLQAACDALAPIKTGEAVITPGFNLPAKFVIHVAGPIYQNWSETESRRHLYNSYINSLKLAALNECKTIALPLISSGIFGYPKEEALQVAKTAIKDFLTEYEMDITLVVFDKESFMIGDKLFGEVESYIDEHYIETYEIKRSRYQKLDRNMPLEFREELYKKIDKLPSLTSKATGSLDYLIGNLDEPFSEMLFKLIDAKQMNDVDVYKRANLSRQLFSKIKSNIGYMPSKRTAVALAIALRLSLDETEDFLKRAGFALSHAVKFDVIIEYFVINGRYDVLEINEVLFKYDQQLLGG